MTKTDNQIAFSSGAMLSWQLQGGLMSNKISVASLPHTFSWLSKNWFFPLAALILIGDVSVAKFVHWDHGTFLEAGLLIDFMVVLPVLYWIFGNRTKAAAARSLALACFGIWICSKTVPTEQQDLLLTFVWLRYVGIGALTLLELGIVASLFKAVMLAGASRSDAQALLEERGMPPWLARIMATEATLWRKLWDFVRRVCGVR